jgi:hypothetical protein
MRYPPYEIRLIAFTTHDDGTRSVCDIVETSFHNASYFARRFMRDRTVSSFIARAPGAIDGGKEWRRAL